jgi:tetratricopeptide (TPR) repeat protein
MADRLARRVALIGWDAADWKVIHPLLDRGLLPNLQSIVERGVMGNLATLEPPFAPLLWTSVATGHTAERHGVLGSVEPDPVLGVLRQVGSGARKSKALWNILSQSGMRSVVVNWQASHPAEEIHGAVVSNRFPTAIHIPGDDWPIVPGAIHPAALEEALAEFRVNPADLTGDDLAPFLPRLAEIDQETDKRPLALAKLLAENITTHAAATWLVEHEQWDLLAVYYDAIGHAGEIFERDFERHRGVMEGVYCFQDMMLGTLMRLAGPETVFALVSGSHHAATDGRRQHGVFAMAGPGVRHDELIFGAGLLDIAPTVLTMLGLPVGEDMRGRVLAEAFDKPVAAERIACWDEVAGEHGMAEVNAEQNPWEASEVVDQLIELGYTEPRSEETARQLEEARREQWLTLARVHLAAGRFEEALPLLEKLIAAQPGEVPYRLYLAQALQEMGRSRESRAVLDPILAENSDEAVAQLLQGNLAVAEGDVERGLECLLRAEAASRPTPELRLAIGRVYLAMNRWDDAERLFRGVLAIAPDFAAAHRGLAHALLAKGKHGDAASAALDSIALRFDDRTSHYLLGASLARLGNPERAAQAFQTCLALDPGMAAARQALSALGAACS